MILSSIFGIMGQMVCSFRAIIFDVAFKAVGDIRTISKLLQQTNKGKIRKQDRLLIAQRQNWNPSL